MSTIPVLKETIAHDTNSFSIHTYRIMQGLAKDLPFIYIFTICRLENINVVLIRTIS